MKKILFLTLILSDSIDDINKNKLALTEMWIKNNLDILLVIFVSVISAFVLIKKYNQNISNENFSLRTLNRYVCQVSDKAWREKWKGDYKVEGILNIMIQNNQLSSVDTYDWFIFYLGVGGGSLFELNEKNLIDNNQSLYDLLKTKNLFMSDKKKFSPFDVLDSLSQEMSKEECIEFINQNGILKTMYDNFCVYIRQKINILFENSSDLDNDSDDSEKGFNPYELLIADKTKHDLHLFSLSNNDKEKENVGFIYATHHTEQGFFRFWQKNDYLLEKPKELENVKNDLDNIIFIRLVGVLPGYQSKGYGGCMLNLIKKYYKGKKLFLYSGASETFTVTEANKLWPYSYNNQTGVRQGKFYKNNQFDEISLFKEDCHTKQRYRLPNSLYFYIQKET